MSRNRAYRKRRWQNPMFFSGGVTCIIAELQMRPLRAYWKV